MKKIIIFGSGDHSKAILAEIIKNKNSFKMIGFYDENKKKNEEIIKINKLLSNLGDSGDSDIEELISIVNSQPNNKEKRFELAEKYLSVNETEHGFNELLIIYEQDPKWDDGAAKKKLLEYFDMLGFTDPNVISARKQLSTLMFK